jgi:hypothetical protein
MTVHYMKIIGRRPKRVGGLSSLRDFITAPGETADVSRLVTAANLSLYCLEDESRQAVFVELPEEVDLTRAPFVFETQYRLARALITAPYTTFTELAARLPPVPRLIMIYMTGRCGSTLLCHVLNELEAVASLSEPEPPSQFAYLKPAYRGREQELHDLLDASMRFMCKAASRKQPTTYVIKPRIETLQAFDVFHACFPQAKNLFLYRDAVGWVSSMFHHLQAAWWPPAMPLQTVLARGRSLCNVDPQPLVPYLGEGVTSISPVQGLTLIWLGLMQEYLDVRARGTQMLAVRYSDLNAHPRQVLHEILEYCDLRPAWRDDAMRVFARDSQEGSALARKNPKEGNRVRFTSEQLEQIKTIIQRHPILDRSDVELPA